MCGEDGTQRVVYKLKEEHAEEGSEDNKKKREKRKAKTEEEKREKRKNCIYFNEKPIVVPALSLQYT